MFRVNGEFYDYSVDHAHFLIHFRLVDISPNYYNMSEFPASEAKKALERLIQKKSQQQRR